MTEITHASDGTAGTTFARGGTAREARTIEAEAKAFERHIADLEDLTLRLSAIADRMDLAAGRLVGSQPVDPQPGGPEPCPDGIIEICRDRVGKLNRVIDEADAALQRIETAV